VHRGLLAPYNCPTNRLALLRFVQDIPLGPKDPSFALVQETQRNLHRLAAVPMLILWGMRDFVFDGDYLAQWQAHFPRAEVRRFENAGHYLFEDQPEATARIIMTFLNNNPVG
jgi:haloalkane dehalogenase